MSDGVADDGLGIPYPEHWTDLRELETAIHCHAEWFKELHRGLIGGLAPKADDLLEDAHRHCRFGRWHYGEHDGALDGHAAFRCLDETHRLMHDYTRAVLSQRQAGNHPEPALYDRLINQSHLFSTEMRALQFHILLTRYALMSPEWAQQRTRFFDQYRSYVINYNLGQDLVRRHIESRGGTPDRPSLRWKEFQELLSSPRVPSMLLRSGNDLFARPRF